MREATGNRESSPDTEGEKRTDLFESRTGTDATRLQP